MNVLAQQLAGGGGAAEGSLGGWYFGLGLGFFLVWVVVILVATVLAYAGRIARQAREATRGLDAARVTTLPLWEIERLDDHAQSILEAASNIRVQVFGEEA